MTHHKFHLVTLARRLVVLVKKNPIGDAALRHEAGRAAVSILSNAAESCSYDGRAKKRFLTIARGSAFELAANYEVAGELGEVLPIDEVLGLTRQIVAISTSIIR